jgi:hypothetical protein
MLIKSSRRPLVASPSQAPTESDKPTEKEASPADPIDSSAPLAGDAGQRIGHFVRGVTLESLQHLRYLSTANAFQQVGSTVGSLALTPLAIRLASDNAPLIGGLAIGGTVAAGAIGALAGYAWLYKKDGDREGLQNFSKLNDTALAVGTALQSLPKFVYPSVIGATDAQRDVIYNALDRLPLHQATASATMQVVPDLLDTGISGMSQPGASHVHILLDESRLNYARSGTELVLHEQAHAVDYSGGFGLLGAHNWKGGFGKAPFVSHYAGSNRYEDFAESFEAYQMDPQGFKEKFPAKAAVIEDISHPDLISGAADRPGVRDTGKKIGTALGKVPYLRTGLELAGSLVAPIQIYRGAGKLADGLESGDEKKQLDGKLNLASGLFLSIPGARPMALATGIAGAAIKATSVEDNEAHMEQANKWADRVLTASAGPVGMAVAAVAGELQSNGLRIDESQGFAPQGWQAARPGKGAMLKGTLSTVGGTVGGALLGAAIGGAVSGSAGAVLGALWGQVAGGMIGLGGYSIHRTLSEGNKQDDPLALTASDKRFLKGTIGGAVAGAGVGTVAGAVGGRMVASALGQAIGGPGTASILGSIGGWAGGLAGAYGGGRLGAGVGSGRLLGRRAELHTAPQTDKPSAS